MPVWTGLANSPFARGRLGTIVNDTNGKIYTLGGNTASTAYLKTVVEYDPVTNVHTQKADLPVAVRYTRGGEIGGKLYIVGGETGTNTGSTVLRVFDPVANTYDNTKAAFPKAIMRGHCQTIEGEGVIIYAGGSNGANLTTAEVWQYTPSNNTWTQKTSMPVARQFGTWAFNTLWVDMFLFGGQNADALWYSTSYFYDWWADAWTQIADIPTVSFGVGAAGYTDDGKFILTAGGEGDPQVSKVNTYIYDPNPNTWTTGTAYPIALYSESYGDVVVNGVRRFYVIEGRNSAGTTYYNNTYLYSDKVVLLPSNVKSKTNLPAAALTVTAGAGGAAIALDGTVKAVSRLITPALSKTFGLAATLKALSNVSAPTIRKAIPLAAILKSVSNVSAPVLKKAIPLAALLKVLSNKSAPALNKAIPLAAPAIKSISNISNPALSKSIPLTTAAIKVISNKSAAVLLKSIPLASEVKAKSSIVSTLSKSMPLETPAKKALATITAANMTIETLEQIAAIPIKSISNVLNSTLSKSFGIGGLVKSKSSAAATLSKTVPLASEVKAVSRTSGTIYKAFTMDSERLAAISDLSASIKENLALAGSISAKSRVVGAIQKIGVTGMDTVDIKAVSNVTASISVNYKLQSVVKSKSSAAAADMQIQRKLSGSIKSKARTAAALDLWKLIDLSGTIKARSGTLADLQIWFVTFLQSEIKAKTRAAGLLGVEFILEPESVAAISDIVISSLDTGQYGRVALEVCLQIHRTLEIPIEIKTSFTVTKQISTGMDLTIDLGGELNECS